MSDLWYTARERCAYRAAAQAVGAVLIGAPLSSASIETEAVIADPGNGSRPCASDRHILGHIFVLVMGVGAVQRYSFGASLLEPHPQDSMSADDLDQVAETSLRLERTDYAAVEMILRYVSELIMQPDVWGAVERIAHNLLEGPLRGSRVALLCTEQGRGV